MQTQQSQNNALNLRIKHDGTEIIELINSKIQSSSLEERSLLVATVTRLLMSFLEQHDYDAGVAVMKSFGYVKSI